MSSVKRHNHRVHPCTTEQKNALLNVLIAQNTIPSSILIVTANDPQHIEITNNSDTVTVMSDAHLAAATNTTCSLLISYDLPLDPAAYILRLERACDTALILLDEDERALLYPIEKLLGRTLIQEHINGFEATFAIKPAPKVRVNKKISNTKALGNPRTFKSAVKAVNPKGKRRKISSKRFKAAKEGA